MLDVSPTNDYCIVSCTLIGERGLCPSGRPEPRQPDPGYEIMEADPASSAPNTLPVLDTEAALVSAGGDAALVRALLDKLLTQLRADLIEMHTHAHNGDLKRLSDKAHKTRGGAAYCGVPALVQALTDLDQRAKAGDAAAARQAMERVAIEAERLWALRLPVSRGDAERGRPWI